MASASSRRPDRPLRRRQITVCREGWYYLGVLWFIIAGALLRDINLLLVLAGMMLGPLLVNWRIIVVTLRRLDVRRQLPESVGVGDLLVVDLTASNQRRRLDSWGLIVEDRIERVVEGQPAEAVRARVLLPRVPAGGTAEAAYRGRLLSRGRYRLGPMTVSTRAPLGFLVGVAPLRRIDTLVVCPRLGRLATRWTRIMQRHRAGSRHSQRRQGLVEGDYYGLRDWRSGDSRRWIHWRTSARRGELAVRQFEQQRNQDLALLLDLCHGPQPSEQRLDQVELAISFVATIVADQCRRGSSRLLVGFTGGKPEWIRGTGSMVLLQEVMHKLAAAQSHTHDQLPQLLHQGLAQIPAGTSTLIVSTRPTDLADSRRFAEVWSDPRKRALVGRIACVDASARDFAQWFQIDPLAR